MKILKKDLVKKSNVIRPHWMLLESYIDTGNFSYEISSRINDKISKLVGQRIHQIYY